MNKPANISRPALTQAWPQGPFLHRNLSVLMYASGFTHWHYRQNGSLAETLDPGFFADAAELIAQQDRVTICAEDGDAEAVFWGHGRRIQAFAMQTLARPEGV